MDIFVLIGRKELLNEAIEHYRKAVKSLPDEYEVWLSLACAYKQLYEIDQLKENFNQADECFVGATKLNSDQAMGWFHWGALYLHAGKFLRDPERLKISLEKFEWANFCEQGIPQVLLLWGEAELLIGSHAEQLENLKQAESKILAALSLLSDLPDAWFIYGLCLEAYGRYFVDESYYLDAIEKYKHALSLTGTHAGSIRFLILHGLSLIHFERGVLKSNLALIDESLDYFKKAAAHSVWVTPQFMNDWGIVLLKKGELTSEKVHIEEALQKFEDTISKGFELTQGDIIELEWLYNYGCALDFLGDYHEDASYYERAIQVLSHILKVDADYSDAKYNLALAYSHVAELQWRY